MLHRNMGFHFLNALLLHRSIQSEYASMCSERKCIRAKRSAGKIFYNVLSSKFFYQRSETLKLLCLWRKSWFWLKIELSDTSLGRMKPAGEQSCWETLAQAGALQQEQGWSQSSSGLGLCTNSLRRQTESKNNWEKL